MTRTELEKCADSLKEKLKEAIELTGEERAKAFDIVDRAFFIAVGTLDTLLMIRDSQWEISDALQRLAARHGA